VAWTHQWTRARGRLVDALERFDDWVVGESVDEDAEHDVLDDD
jgi:hypothetical protein